LGQAPKLTGMSKPKTSDPEDSIMAKLKRTRILGHVHNFFSGLVHYPHNSGSGSASYMEGVP
jgi:hypothetical protein